MYDDEKLVTLQYVCEARRLGLTVADIGRLHDCSNGPQAKFCETARRTVARRIEIVDRRIEELTRTRAGLTQWLSACRARSAEDACSAFAALKAAREQGTSNPATE